MGSGNSKPPVASSPSIVKPNTSNVVGGINAAAYTPDSNASNKYAVIIGINYIGESFKLNGCINDAINVKNYLEQLGFSITLMTDNSSGNLYPSKINIISEITNKVNLLKANDTLVVYYSGHGSRITDTNGDEISGLDSVIVPVNVASQGYIVDDTLRFILSRAVADSNIFAVFDSCNSGSVCDLRYNYFDTSYREYPGNKQTDLINRNNVIVNNRYFDTDANIVSLSGCKDNEFSYESVTANGQIGGALTYSFLKCIQENTPAITFAQLLQNIRSLLNSSGFNQTPSLMSGKTFDPTVSLSSFLKV